MIGYPVFLSPLAEHRIEGILAFLRAEWGEPARDRFIAKLRSSLELIGRYPGGAPSSSAMPGVRRLVVTKQTAIYYRVAQDAVEVITVIDTRQDPEAIKRELRELFG